MKTFVWTGVALLFGVGTGLVVATMEHSSSGEHFVPNSAPNPSSRSDNPITGVKGYPQIELVNGETFDFGEEPRGASGSHTFVIRNRGDKPLELLIGETTCKCTFITDGTFDKDGEKPTIVEPGETLEVELQWVAEEMLIKFSQSATLETNDPDRSTVRLGITGIVNQALRIVPDRIAWPTLTSTQGADSEAVLFCGEQLDEWEILDVQFGVPSTSDFFEVEIEDLSPEKLAELAPDENYASQVRSGRLLKIRVKPGLPFGKLHQSIKVTTSMKDVDDLILDLEGYVIADISVIGRNFDAGNNILSMSAIEGENGSREFALQLLVKGEHRATTEFEIIEVEPADVLKVRLGEKLQSAKLTRIPLIIHIPAGTPPIARGQDDDCGLIRLKTNHPDVTEVKLYVEFIVK
ncbi:MAG TPA: DUF1573 domain-containing protein [Planctomycetes bacterium]|nr:DUF1573 domain-containing protein [Planctomycetota bacterium]